MLQGVVAKIAVEKGEKGANELADQGKSSYESNKQSFNPWYIVIAIVVIIIIIGAGFWLWFNA